MKEEQVKEISIQLYILQTELQNLLDELKEESQKKTLKNKISDLKKIDSLILKSSDVKFSEKQKTEHLLKELLKRR